jgi:regulator of protease activity HflC (stomatin/prohibitin superfamily)
MKSIIKTAVLLGFCSLISGCGVWYAEWQAEIRLTELRGQGAAELAQSESSKKIQIEDARGKLEAATYLANAEIERAKGVAEANKIIGDSLKGNEAYLRYLYISNLEKAESNGSVNTIYIPTEAGLPILEAGKR